MTTRAVTVRCVMDQLQVNWVYMRVHAQGERKRRKPTVFKPNEPSTVHSPGFKLKLDGDMKEGNLEFFHREKTQEEICVAKLSALTIAGFMFNIRMTETCMSVLNVAIHLNLRQKAFKTN